MEHTIRRIFFYVLYVVMLILAAVGARPLVQFLLGFTFLSGSNGAAGADVFKQAIVSLVVWWIITVPLAVLFYQLLRRERQSDPQAGSGGVRAFFLNIPEGISLLLGVGVGAFAVIVQLGRGSSFEVFGSSVTLTAPDLTGPAAFALLSLALAAVLGWDRRQAQAGPGVALVFQRLHFYFVQLILLFFLTFSWFTTVRQLLDAIFFGGQGAASNADAFGSSFPGYCGGFTLCSGPNLLSLAASLLWIILFWVGYGLVTRNDNTPSVLRQILHFISFAYGLIAVISGLVLLVDLILVALIKQPLSVGSIIGPSASYDFITPLLFGLIVTGVYWLWLRIPARQQSTGLVGTFLTLEAITATLLGLAFWLGVSFLLFFAFGGVGSSALPPTAWTAAWALVITGLSYILLDIDLRGRSVKTGNINARRGFVFVLLGIGTLSAVLGLAALLYALGTSSLGAAGNNPVGLQSGAAGLLVGAAMVGIYLWRVWYEQLLPGKFARAAAPSPTPVPSGVAPMTVPSEMGPMPSPTEVSPPVVVMSPVGSAPSSVEDVLDAVLAGKITRDEAATRIHTMIRPAP